MRKKIFLSLVVVILFLGILVFSISDYKLFLFQTFGLGGEVTTAIVTQKEFYDTCNVHNTKYRRLSPGLNFIYQISYVLDGQDYLNSYISPCLDTKRTLVIGNEVMIVYFLDNPSHFYLYTGYPNKIMEILDILFYVFIAFAVGVVSFLILKKVFPKSKLFN